MLNRWECGATVLLSGPAVKASRLHFSQQSKKYLSLRNDGCQSKQTKLNLLLNSSSVSVLPCCSYRGPTCSQKGAFPGELGKQRSIFEALSQRLSGSCGPQDLGTCSSLSSTSVQVRTWTSPGKSSFWQQRPRGLEVKSDFTAAYHVSSVVFVFYLSSLRKCDLPHWSSVLIFQVTCESDRLNPDLQLSLTCFIFGTCGFLTSSFFFCMGSWSLTSHSFILLTDIQVVTLPPSACPLQLAGFKLATLQLESRFCQPERVEPFGGAHWI